MEQKIKDEITYVELPRDSDSIKFMWKLYSSFLLKDNKTKINSYCYAVGKIWGYEIASTLDDNITSEEIIRININQKLDDLIKLMEEFEKTKEYKIETSETWYFINGEWEEKEYGLCTEKYEKYIEKAIAKKTIKTEEVYYLSDNNPIRKFNKKYPSSL